jgi:hypothetical protein
MTWDEALECQDLVKDVVKEWSHRVKGVDKDDLFQDLMIFLVESVQSERATGNLSNYIRAACWKRAHTLLLNPRARSHRSMLSLDTLASEGLQVTDKREAYRPRRHPRAVDFSIEYFETDDNSESISAST